MALYVMKVYPLDEQGALAYNKKNMEMEVGLTLMALYKYFTENSLVTFSKLSFSKKKR